MPIQRVIVIGTSAGGLEALRLIAGALPEDLPAAVCIVRHMSPSSPSVLHEILDRAGALRAVLATDAARLQAGRIYVSPPDHHLMIERDRLRLTKGPKENRFRPAVDPLFRSAAQAYGRAVIGVVLTGNLDDGTAGLLAIKQFGGVSIVQDPADALYPSMPRSACQHVKPDYCVPLIEIAPLLVALASTPAETGERSPVPERVKIEVNIAKEQLPKDAGLERIAEPSPYTCPDCHGVLLRLKESDPVRFRCHTGHAYSVATLAAAVHEGIDDALWNGIRALEEGALLMEHMAEHLTSSADRSAELVAAAKAARRQAAIIRGLSAEHNTPAADQLDPQT